MKDVRRKRISQKLKKKRAKEHEQVVETLYEHPEIITKRLSLKGTLLLRKKEFKFPKETKRSPSIDLLFVYDAERIIILGVEVKVSYMADKKGKHQLALFRNFFKRNWKNWLKKEIPSFSFEKPVFLISLLIVREFLLPLKDWYFYKREVCLYS